MSKMSRMIFDPMSNDVVRIEPYAGNVCAGGRNRNTESQWNGIARRCVCRSFEVRRGAPARRCAVAGGPAVRVWLAPPIRIPSGARGRAARAPRGPPPPRGPGSTVLKPP